MSDIVFEVLKLLVMVAALLISTYIVPWIKAKIGEAKLAEVKLWAEQVVLMVQQVYKGWTGDDKKQFVVDFLERLLIQKNISISDEQLDILIEAAVKQMKMSEGVVLEAVDIEKGEE